MNAFPTKGVDTSRERNHRRNDPTVHSILAVFLKRTSSTIEIEMDGVSTYLALTFGTLLSSQGTDASFRAISPAPPGTSLRCVHYASGFPVRLKIEPLGGYVGTPTLPRRDSQIVVWPHEGESSRDLTVVATTHSFSDSVNTRLPVPQRQVIACADVVGADGTDSPCGPPRSRSATGGMLPHRPRPCADRSVPSPDQRGGLRGC